MANERPYGIDLMVDEAVEACREVIEEIREQGEAQDEFYRQLNEPVMVDFSKEHIRNVAKALTFLTDTNVIVDETVFSDLNPVLKPHVTIKTEKPWPLRMIISHLCRQTGLAYSVESDHVFISTRVKMDRSK
jgi:type II secretory pathway component GspD/PulD (secretin)